MVDLRCVRCAASKGRSCQDSHRRVEIGIAQRNAAAAIAGAREVVTARMTRP